MIDVALQAAVEKDLADHFVVGELLLPAIEGSAFALCRLAVAKGEHCVAAEHAVERFQGLPAFAGLTKDPDVLTGAQVVAVVFGADRRPFAGVGSVSAEGVLPNNTSLSLPFYLRSNRIR